MTMRSIFKRLPLGVVRFAIALLAGLGGLSVGGFGAEADELAARLAAWRSYPLIEVMHHVALRDRYAAASGEGYFDPFDATPAQERRLRQRDLDRLARFAPPVRNALLATELYDAMGVNGIHHFLVGTEGRLAPETAAALQDMGLRRHAALLTDAMALFGKPYPIAYKTRRARSRLDEKPSSVDAFLMEIARRFGSRAEFGKVVEQQAGENAVVRAFFDKAAASIDDDTRASWLAFNVVGLVDTWASEAEITRELGLLPRPYQIIFLLQTFQMEMLNGSVHQYFYNSSGAVARQVVDALREVGLATHADAVQKGIDAFPAPYPVDTMARRKLLFVGGEERPLDKLLGDLTGDVDDGGIQVALVALMKREDILPIYGRR
jgi:hypothetical protein